ncbi:MAG TPA: hypothetical protein VGE67_07425 [Haloferula sp.]
MLENREKVQATEQHRLAGIGTRIVAGVVAALVIGFFSFSDNREAVASMFREPAPEAETGPQPRALPSLELLDAPAKSAGGQESASEELTRTANTVTAGPLLTPEGLAPGGKVVSKEDIGFAMQLLNFAQGPPTQEAPKPAEKAKEK